MRFSAAAAGVALAALPLWAFAEGYAGLNYVQLEQDDRFFGDDRFETGELMFRLGGNINEYWVMELRGGATVSPKEDGGPEFQHDYFYGAMARFQWPVGVITPYLGVGYSEIRESLTGDGFDDESTYTDSSFAAGMDLRLGDSLGLHLEYFQLSDEEDVAKKGPSFGVFYSF